MGILMPLDQLARQLRRFVGQAVVGEIAAQQQNVGFDTRDRRRRAAAACPRDPLP